MKHLLRPGPLAAMLFGLTWIVLVVWEIAVQPPDGEDTRGTLSAEVSKAVTASDPNALQRLFLSKTTGDDYANTFISHLRATSPSGVRVAQDGSDIRLTAAASHRGPLCVRWPTTKLDGRWLLDPTPSLPARC